MITGLHHVAISVKNIAEAVRDYETLLGQKVSWRGEVSGGDEAWFELANLKLVLSAPAEPSERQATSDGISRMAFSVGDVAKAHRLVTQRAIGAEAPQIEQFGDSRLSATWLSQSATHGIHIGLVEAGSGPAATSGLRNEGLDHLVVGTPDAERAIVLYGGRLGLDLRLDRSNPDWDARLLFFRCGDLIIEVAHRLSEGRGEGADRFMGLSWRARDIVATQGRLAKAGFNVSEVRRGRRPGTRVFTVRDRTCGVPTIFVGPEAS